MFPIAHRVQLTALYSQVPVGNKLVGTESAEATIASLIATRGPEPLALAHNPGRITITAPGRPRWAESAPEKQHHGSDSDRGRVRWAGGIESWI